MLLEILRHWPVIPPLPFMISGAAHAGIGIFAGLSFLLGGLVARANARWWLDNARSPRGRLRFGAERMVTAHFMIWLGVVTLFLGSYVFALLFLGVFGTLISAVMDFRDSVRERNR
jgi:hypothetical protein